MLWKFLELSQDARTQTATIEMGEQIIWIFAPLAFERSRSDVEVMSLLWGKELDGNRETEGLAGSTIVMLLPIENDGKKLPLLHKISCPSLPWCFITRGTTSATRKEKSARSRAYPKINPTITTFLATTEWQNVCSLSQSFIGVSVALGPSHPTIGACSQNYASIVNEIEGQSRDVWYFWYESEFWFYPRIS